MTNQKFRDLGFGCQLREVQLRVPLNIVTFLPIDYEDTKAINQLFPIECSLPCMLVNHAIESRDAGMLESVLMPFDIYNDAAQHALVVLKQSFLYDEMEAEVDNRFDIFTAKLCDSIFTYDKSWAASICLELFYIQYTLPTYFLKYSVKLNLLHCSGFPTHSELLDPSFLFAIDVGEKFSIQPMRFTAIFKMTKVKACFSCMYTSRALGLGIFQRRMTKVLTDTFMVFGWRCKMNFYQASYYVIPPTLCEIIKNAISFCSEAISTLCTAKFLLW